MAIQSSETRLISDEQLADADDLRDVLKIQDRLNRAIAQESNNAPAFQRDNVDEALVVTRWEVPEEVLGLADNWQQEHQQTLTLAMPAEERAWRDVAHYKAYVRPTETYKITEVTE